MFSLSNNSKHWIDRWLVARRWALDLGQRGRKQSLKSWNSIYGDWLHLVWRISTQNFKALTFAVVEIFRDDVEIGWNVLQCRSSRLHKRRFIYTSCSEYLLGKSLECVNKLHTWETSVRSVHLMNIRVSTNETMATVCSFIISKNCVVRQKIQKRYTKALMLRSSVITIDLVAKSISPASHVY